MATIATQSQSPALTFPRPIFAAVSPHPFLQAHLSTNKTTPTRANGRTPLEFRKPGINTGSLTHANGSAVVRLGNTSVVCGVRAEILKEEDIPAGHDTTNPSTSPTDATEIDTLRLLVPNVELSTGSTPNHIPGNAPSPYAQTLITKIRSLALSTNLLRTDDLRIVYTPSMNAEDATEAPEQQVKAYWVLYVDIFFISIDGGAFDAAWISMLAALRDTKLPFAWYDEEFEGVLCSDEVGQARRLELRGLPVPATFGVFEGRGDGDDGVGMGECVLGDPDAFEEGVCREGVCVVVDVGGGGEVVVRRVEKSGGGLWGGGR
ncbi:ribosomal protein S5 domain 2-type protein [Phaeosphaeriaceae sp. PMI808]|nr:ribosomal protein S5 domain 2-type protein [Phaeosphaeriaceae sp. PMI808]